MFAEEGVTLETLDALESDIVRLVSPGHTVESENRVREKLNDNNMKKGFILILGARPWVEDVD